MEYGKVLSLSSLTSDVILKNLPVDCLDKLKDALVRDRSYDLSKYIEVPETPSGLFVIFAYYNGIIQYNGLTGDPISEYSGWNHLLDQKIIVHAYWVPISGFNDIFYFNEQPTPQSTLYVTMYDFDLSKCYDGMSLIRIHKCDREQKEDWIKQGSPCVDVKYFYPRL